MATKGIAQGHVGVALNEPVSWREDVDADTPWLHHSIELAQCSLQIPDMFDHLAAYYQVNGLVGEGNSVVVRANVSVTVAVTCGVTGPCLFYSLMIYVNTHDAPVAAKPEDFQQFARTTAEVEYLHVCVESSAPIP